MMPSLAPAIVKQHSRIPPPVPLVVANISRAQANALRAQWLVGLAGDLLTVSDLLAFAATPKGRPLRRISLWQLLTTQVGWGQARAAAALAHLRALLRCTAPNSAMTIGWLLDNRTGGRRLVALTTALSGQDNAPWPGYPFEAQPD